MFENQNSLTKLLNHYMIASSHPFETKEIIADIDFHETEFTPKEMIDFYLTFVEKMNKLLKNNKECSLIKNGFLVREKFKSENLDEFEIIVTMKHI